MPPCGSRLWYKSRRGKVVDVSLTEHALSQYYARAREIGILEPSVEHLADSFNSAIKVGKNHGRVAPLARKDRDRDTVYLTDFQFLFVVRQRLLITVVYWDPARHVDPHAPSRSIPKRFDVPERLVRRQ